MTANEMIDKLREIMRKYDERCIMDIGSGKAYPANALSNFACHPFVIDDVECASMEGFLQGLKFENPDVQVEVCKLTGKAAKNRGQKRNRAWKKTQTLWWKGVPFIRDSVYNHELLDRAYDALLENQDFRKALEATIGASLSHSIGHNKVNETVLTEREFVRQLYRLRAKIMEELRR